MWKFETNAHCRFAISRKPTRKSKGDTGMRATFDRYFLSHPHSVDESYVEHAGVAFRFAVRLLGAGLAALVHAVIPCLFEKTASSIIKTMHGEMASRSTPPHR
jgi:hypothetical protein